MRWRSVVRTRLAGFMVVAGVAHLVAHDEFLGQVPTWLPAPSAIVWGTGAIEVAGRLLLQPALIAVALSSTDAWPRTDRRSDDTTTGPPLEGPG